MSEYFSACEIDSPRVVAEMLLAHVIGCERMRLYMEVDRPASPEELAELRALVARAAKHEPVQYITGHVWFFGREFEVGRATLIPRPSTETLIEQVLQWCRVSARPSPLLADIGTGTGCIAITLAAQIKDARIVATDIVPEALELAKRNAERHGVADRIEFVLGLGTEALEGRTAAQRREFDAICSNPPYISDHEWETEVDRNVKEFEQESALRAGPEGLDVIAPLIAGAVQHLAPGGQLFVEIGYKQRERVLELVSQAPEAWGLTDATVIKDHEGLWRVLIAARAT